MDDEKYQKELFEFEKPKRFLPRLSDFFPKADFERNVILTLTLDRAVFITIGIIMTMVVIYALGVEAGKARPEAAASVAAPVVVAPVAVKAPDPVPAPIVTPVRAAPAAAKAVPVPVVVRQPAPVVQRPAAVISTSAKPYTIVAVTLTRRDTAVLEVNKLKRQGMSAVIVPKGNYFQVCIGAYSGKTDVQSQKDLKKVRSLYKDAYLKLR